MSATDLFVEDVKRRTVDTPYVVEETPQGFDLRLDSEHEKWAAEFRESGRKAFWWHVILDEGERSLIIDDESDEHDESGDEDSHHPFHHDESRDLIRAVADEHDWTEKHSHSRGERGGFAITAPVLVGAALLVVALLVLAIFLTF